MKRKNQLKNKIESMKNILNLLLIIVLSLINITILKAQEVEVIGDLKIVNGSQGEGNVLVSDADGVSKWISKDILFIEQFKDKPDGVKKLIEWGFSPIDIMATGVEYDSLLAIPFPALGSSANFRHIFFIDTSNVYPFEYLMVGEEAFTYSNWACSGTAITGADGTAQGDGEQNTLDVLSDCPTPPSVFTQSLNVPGGGFYIASEGEAQLIYTEVIAPGYYSPAFPNNNKYWTSTEGTGANEATHAKVLDISTGIISEEEKTFSTRALLVKKFY